MSAFTFTRRFLVAALVALPVAAAATTFHAEPAAAGKPQIFAPGGKAIRGYDPVAYFTQRKPVKGSAKYTHKWKGATWYFSSARHRNMFKRNPTRYAPQYGGYCAYGIAQGYVVKIEVDQWAIVNGKLYLNYSRGVQSRWKKDVPGYIKTADKKWPSILN